MQLTQTASDVVVQAVPTYSSAAHALHAEQTRSRAEEHNSDSHDPAGQDATVQLAHSVSAKGVHAADTYAPAPQVLHDEHRRSALVEHASDSHDPAAHADVEHSEQAVSSVDKHAPLTNVEAGHGLHGRHTVSLCGVHGSLMYSSAAHVAHASHVLSAVGLQEAISNVPAGQSSAAHAAHWAWMPTPLTSTSGSALSTRTASITTLPLVPSVDRDTLPGPTNSYCPSVTQCTSAAHGTQSDAPDKKVSVEAPALLSAARAVPAPSRPARTPADLSITRIRTSV